LRTFTIILGLTISIQIVSAQTVPSICTAPDTIVSKYEADADRLALRKIYLDSLPYIDSIIIPQEHSDTVLKALLAVYNATSLPARDTVVVMFDIHSFPYNSLNLFYFAADSNLSWMQALKNGILPSGNQVIDSLLSLFNFSIYQYSSHLGLSLHHSVYFISESNYNLLALTSLISTLPDILYSQGSGYGGDGYRITDKIYSDHIELTYSTGWGDCPSGCIKRRYWKFNVYFDCSVEYVESYGDLLPSTGTPPPTGIIEPSKNLLIVYPIPTSQSVTVQHSTEVKKENLSIYNLLGVKMQVEVHKDRQIDLSHLPDGVYFLRIHTEKGIVTRRVVKQTD